MDADRTPRSRRGRPSGGREAIVIALAVVAVFFVGVSFNVFDRVDAFLRRSAPIAPDDVLAIATLSAIGLGVFSIRRGRAVEGETKLRKQTEERFRTLVEEVPAITYSWDARRPAGEAPPLYVSPQIEAILGYTLDEWLANPNSWVDHIHPDDRGWVT